MKNLLIKILGGIMVVVAAQVIIIFLYINQGINFSDKTNETLALDNLFDTSVENIDADDGISVGNGQGTINYINESKQDEVEPEKFIVEFVSKENIVLKTENVISGKNATAPEAPIVEGYYFKNWSESFENVKNDLTVTAQYTEIEELIDFDWYNPQQKEFILESINEIMGLAIIYDTNEELLKDKTIIVNYNELINFTISDDDNIEILPFSNNNMLVETITCEYNY